MTRRQRRSEDRPGDGPTTVIEGTREDWPGGARTLTLRDPSRKPNGHTFWFGAELAPDGNQSVVPDHFGGRPLDEGADARRGPAATAWSTSSRLDAAGPPVGPRPQPWVSDDGDTRIERYDD